MLRALEATAERLAGGPERVLYVEGRKGSLDPHALTPLLAPFAVDVRAIGGCDELAAAVRALRWADEAAADLIAKREHYCILDRDHRSDEEVEATWEGPFTGELPLLYWRRHEIENYFVEPEFLIQSRYVKNSATVAKMERKLLVVAREHVYLDAANLVIKELRAKSKHFELEEFKLKEAAFGSPDEARESLLSARNYDACKRRRSRLFGKKRLTSRFDHYLGLMVGKSAECPLGMGQGRWLQLMEGSKLAPAVIAGQFFQVPRGDGGNLQGRPMFRRVVEDLMRRFDELEYKPQDLVELRDFFAKTAP